MDREVADVADVDVSWSERHRHWARSMQTGANGSGWELATGLEIRRKSCVPAGVA